MTTRHTATEALKLGLRRALLHLDLDLGRDAFVRRVARTLADRNIDTVLDVGANEGQYAALLRAAGYRGRIVSIEPLPDAFDRLQRRSRTDSRWIGERLAVGAEVGRTTIHVSANSYSSSVLPLAPAHLEVAPESRVVESIEVDVTTVLALAEAHDLVPERTLLKIDTQGFEGAVLAGAGDWLTRVAAVQLEVSHVELYTGQPLEPELTAQLADRGLVPWTNDPGISAADGRLLQSDVLFART